MRELAVVIVDQVRHVDVAEVLLEEHVLADLVSGAPLERVILASFAAAAPVDEDVVERKGHDELDQRLLYARRGRRILAAFAFLAAKEADCVRRLPVCHVG